MKQRILHIIIGCLSLLALTFSNVGPLNAQTPLESKKFIIKDATGERANPPADGILDVKFANMDSVTVYVTWTASADSVEAYYRNNPDMYASFINFYNDKGYFLRPNAKGQYDLADANSIAEDLYREFQPMIDYWIAQRRAKGYQGENLYSVALLIFREGKPIEKHEINPILNYGGDDLVCPIYFIGANKTENVDFSKKTRVGTITKLTVVKGDLLPISENFHISGPENYRMVVDRYIETCTFDEDYQRVLRMFKENRDAQAEATRLLKYKDSGDGFYRQQPYVFAGKEFQKSLLRRSGWDLSRDTMEYYRKETQRAFAQSLSGNKVKTILPDSVSFNIENNLWYEICKYSSFAPIKQSLCAVSSLLPADGGRYDDGDESHLNVYELRTDTALFNRLSAYVERGYRISTDSAKVRTSSDIHVEGWVSKVNRINLHPSEYKEFMVMPDYASVLLADSSDFQQMQRDAQATVVHTAPDHSMRVRVALSSERRFIDLFQHSADDYDPIYLTPSPIDTVTNWGWRMPDPHKYYSMKHVYYLHDFIHADTTSSVECPCARLNPMQFLAPIHSSAMHDCPPMRMAGIYENFRPVSSTKDPKTVDKYAYLQFDLASTAINVHKDSNEAQLNILKMAAYDIKHEEGTNNRIDSIRIVGISSPEGARERNVYYSRGRGANLGSWIRSNCEGTQYTRMVPVDSVASWFDVADVLAEMDTAYVALADSLRSSLAGIDPYDTDAQNKIVAYRRGSVPAYDMALDRLRKVQVRFFYQATSDPSEETVVKAYLKGNNPELFDAYYYYVLLNSDQIPHEDKLKLASLVLNLQKNRVKNFTKTQPQPTGKYWFDLVLPVAANLIAVDSIKAKHWDTEILRPFIDPYVIRGNIESVSENEFIEGDLFKVYKYVNLDFILYNQIQMLLGLSDAASLEEANTLIQILVDNTRSTSTQFTDKYDPKALKDFLDCHLKSFAQDEDLAERMKKTHLLNFYVVNMAIANEIFATTGDYANPKVKNAILDCQEKLAEFQEQYPGRAEMYYFTAAAEARYAEAAKGYMSVDEFESFNTKQHFDNAIHSLVHLFKIDQAYIGRCQGDRYIRDIYSSPEKRRANVDIYLEAIEAYINDTLNNNQQ